ncbi:MAG: CvpA family protein [Pseudoflavonifractor sp.]|nr:CvpA family protein [Pseudoflavonifractor sp.]
MSFIDIVILIVFAGAVIVGLRKGMIAQLGSLAAVILGIVACRLWGGDAARIAASLIPELTTDSETSGYAASVVGNVTLFVIVYLSVKLLASLVRNVTHALMLGVIDRVLGVLFCLFKWFLVLSIVLNLWDALFPSSGLLSSSRLGDGLAMRTVLNLAPKVFGGVTAPNFITNAFVNN